MAAEVLDVPSTSTLANISGLSLPAPFATRLRIGRVRVDGSRPTPTASTRDQKVSAGYAGTVKRSWPPLWKYDASFSGASTVSQSVEGSVTTTRGAPGSTTEPGTALRVRTTPVIGDRTATSPLAAVPTPSCAAVLRARRCSASACTTCQRASP